MERTFESQGYVEHFWHRGLLADAHSARRYFWLCGGRIMAQQKGVFRVNCIDCLDRTNVVQVSRSLAVAPLPAHRAAVYLLSI